MIVLAIIATLAAVVVSLLVIGANGMRSSPGRFAGRTQIAIVWIMAATFWLAWWVS